MPDPAPKAELMRSLGRLARGLSALFWGLPLTMVVGVQTVQTNWLEHLGMAPSILTSSLLLFGLMQLGGFQRQERVWVRALDGSKLLATINLGLSPFLFWWHRVPDMRFFALVVGILAITGLGFLVSVNHLLRRLTAMLPVETLRQETRTFTLVNFYLISAAIFFLGASWIVAHFILMPGQAGSFPGFQEAMGRDTWPIFVQQIVEDGSFQWCLVFLILLPVAITMAMLWKIKEIILASVFASSDS
ncbi:MAG: hypothetical protein M1608_10595 [Candidatus Omnitrophica bacterium]|nr:hypothetical protein [Candidatus Omnitrophota bacterium]